jgi:PPOX class probable F420-dependent enzyme
VAQSLTDDQLSLLQSIRVGHLATVDEHDQPHVVPVCFAWHQGAIYTPIDEKPKRPGANRLQRERNIERNAAVCLTIDRYDEDWTRLAWLQIRGTAAILGSGLERPSAIAALRERYPQYLGMNLESRPLIQITPRIVRSWRAG